MKIAGQVAIVTGGGSGLGRAMALGLASKGAKILIADAREAEGKRVLEEVRSLGSTGHFFVGDLSQEKTAQQMVDSCIQGLRGLNILINNAGLRMEQHEDGIYEPWRCLKTRPIHELPVEEWDLLLNINLRAVFLCTHFALPHMIGQKQGTIISISSNAGSHGVPGKSAYCASKHAIEGLMKTVAEEMQDYGISANAIHPGGRVNVDGRGGQSPDVVVPLVLFLAGQDQPMITGRTIRAKDWNEKKV
ncbi:MAG: SDR family NAD(P)-dependent oxidoreductase [Deltaproteobacteria bacterium]|nr:SDR family NAD(P)-dependent oxidoreductase [Deltaproteobacteria bacterium]